MKIEGGEWAIFGPELKSTGYRLAMLSLQSDRYAEDPEFREAVDDCLAVERWIEERKKL